MLTTLDLEKKMTALINKVRSSLESNTSCQTVEDVLHMVVFGLVGSVMWLSIAQM